MDHPLDTGTPKGIKEKEDYLKEIEEFQKRMRPEHRGEGGIKVRIATGAEFRRGESQTPCPPLPCVFSGRGVRYLAGSS